MERPRIISPSSKVPRPGKVSKWRQILNFWRLIESALSLTNI